MLTVDDIEVVNDLHARNYAKAIWDDVENNPLIWDSNRVEFIACKEGMIVACYEEPDCGGLFTGYARIMHKPTWDKEYLKHYAICQFFTGKFYTICTDRMRRVSFPGSITKQSLKLVS